MSIISHEESRKLFFDIQNLQDELAARYFEKDDQGNKIGYVPRNKNEVLARLMDAGKLIYGTIHEKDYRDDWLNVSMQVYLDD